MKNIALVAALCVLCSCKHVAQVPSPLSYENRFTSICEINKNKEAYIDKEVDIRAIYKTDSLTYSYLVDENCKGNNQISPGYFNPNQTPGLAELISEGKERCKGRGICALRAVVEIKALVVMLDDHELGLDLRRVSSYNYLQSGKIKKRINRINGDGGN